jgi:hypothetical protein
MLCSESFFRPAKLLRKAKSNRSTTSTIPPTFQYTTSIINMGAPAWAIPVGVLGGLCLACLVFIWWYIPRLYTKGVQADINRVAQEKAERERQAAAVREAGGEDTDVEARVVRPVVKEFKYTPAAYTAY